MSEIQTITLQPTITPHIVRILPEGLYTAVDTNVPAEAPEVPVGVLPEKVRKCTEALFRCGIGFTLTRNEAAYSCADAAEKRLRDGVVGIPLEDELKTLVFKRRRPDEHGFRYLAAHCRAADQLSFAGVMGEILGKKSSQLQDEELASTFDGAEYGCVNPVLLATRADELGYAFWNACDSRLFSGGGTVMTNAGDHTFGLEFKPRDMFEKLPGYYAVLPVRK